MFYLAYISRTLIVNETKVLSYSIWLNRGVKREKKKKIEQAVISTISSYKVEAASSLYIDFSRVKV